MKIVRFDQGGSRYGELKEDVIHPLDGEIGALRPSSEEPVALASTRLLTPCLPSKIVAVGPNYRAHLNGGSPPPRPYLWIKPSSTLLAPEGTIEMPSGVPAVCHESELAIVIGLTGRDVAVEDAPDHIFGYTCINDVSAGQLDDMATYLASQFFVDGKIFDTFSPLGPLIDTDVDPHDLRVQCRINGQTRQDHRTSDQIWRPAELVAIISRVVTLYPGDVIATGSPPRPGPFAAGDVIEVEIEHIGTLRSFAASRSNITG